jgi:hypothetical protein
VLDSSILKNEFMSLLQEGYNNQQSPFSSSCSSTHVKAINVFVEDITKTEQDVLLNFPIIPEDQKELYFEDLNRRSLANDRIKDIITKEIEFPHAIYKARLAEDTNWKKYFIADTKSFGFSTIGIIYPPAGLSAIMMEEVWKYFNTFR